MNRYFLYNYVLVSLINLMLYVPHILIQYRYTGAVSSIIIGTVIGSALIYAYTSVITKFPGKGMPEILKMYFPRWIVTINMLLVTMMWLFASIIVIIAYALLINRYLNPDINPIVIIIMLVIACGYAATRSTLTVIFMIEIGVLINVPFIAFFLFKASRSPHLNWDAIRVVANYVTEMPNLTSIAAASFIFTGYLNLSLFNRLISANFRFKHRWIYPIIGFTILLITFFIPIGFHGTEEVNQYIYIWTVTADSMLMKYGFIERVLFVFLVIYLNLSLVYTMSIWHQAMEFIKSCFPKNEPLTDSPETPLSNYVIIASFAILTILYALVADEQKNMFITSYWLSIRLFLEIFIVLWIFILSRRRPKSS